MGKEVERAERTFEGGSEPGYSCAANHRSGQHYIVSAGNGRCRFLTTRKGTNITMQKSVYNVASDTGLIMHYNLSLSLSIKVHKLQCFHNRVCC